jgi:hypothetical protein
MSIALYGTAPRHDAPVAEIEAAGIFVMPNGGLLRRGARVRVPADLPWKIDNDTVRALGLKLDNSHSSGSEVIRWPLPAEVAEDRALDARLTAEYDAVQTQRVRIERLIAPAEMAAAMIN